MVWLSIWFCLKRGHSGKLSGLVPFPKLLHSTRPCEVWGIAMRQSHMGLSENSVPLHPMVLLIIIPFLNGYIVHWEYTLFSDKPKWQNLGWWAGILFSKVGAKKMSDPLSHVFQHYIPIFHHPLLHGILGALEFLWHRLWNQGDIIPPMGT